MKNTLLFTTTLGLLFSAATLLADTDNSWNFSVGAGVRTGIKITGKGGTFDMLSTGFVRPDANPNPNVTSDWGVNDPATQIHVPDGSYTGVGPTDLYYMDFTSVNGASSSSTTMPSFEISIGRDLVVEEDFTLGVRLSFGGAFGLNKDARASSTQWTYVFTESTVAPPVPGTDNVFLNDPANGPTSVPGESTRMNVKGALWKVGLGPEFSMQDETGLGLTLQPFVSLNIASAKVDGTQVDALGATMASVSASKNKVLFGGGIAATVFCDVTDNWTVGASVGYEFLPKMDILGNGLGAEVAFSAFTVGANAMWRF